MENTNEVPRPTQKPAEVVIPKEQAVVEKQQTDTVKPSVSSDKILIKWYGEDEEIQKIVNYAYQLWWETFVLTLNGENWLRQRDRRSVVIWANWYYDYWLCQLNAQRHWKFIFKNGYNLKDWFSDDFKQPYKQLEYCRWVFQDWVAKKRIHTTFYAYNHREKSRKFFIF